MCIENPLTCKNSIHLNCQKNKIAFIKKTCFIKIEAYKYTCIFGQQKGKYAYMESQINYKVNILKVIPKWEIFVALSLIRLTLITCIVIQMALSIYSGDNMLFLHKNVYHCICDVPLEDM